MNRYPHRVPDSVGIDPPASAIRVELQDVSAVMLRGITVGVVHVGTGPHRHKHLAPIAGERDVPRPMPAAGWNVSNHHLGWASGLEIPIFVREAHHRVRVPHVDKPGIRPRWVERDTERPLQSAGVHGNRLCLAIRAGAAQHLDAPGPALGDEQVSVRRRPKQPRVFQLRGIERHLETWKRLGPGVGRAGRHPGPVGGGLRLIWLRQIRNGDLPDHTGFLLPVVREGGLPFKHAAARGRVRGRLQGHQSTQRSAATTGAEDRTRLRFFRFTQPALRSLLSF